MLIDSDKVVAGEFKCKVADADGATQFSWVARQLDKDGDFVMLFREDDRREHRRLLGNLPTPSATYSSATKVPSRGLTDEEVVSVAKTLAAAVANAIAQDRVDNGEGGLLNSFVIEFASKARDEAVQARSATCPVSLDSTGGRDASADLRLPRRGVDGKPLQRAGCQGAAHLTTTPARPRVRHGGGSCRRRLPNHAGKPITLKQSPDVGPLRLKRGRGPTS